MLQPMIVIPKILDRRSNTKRNRFPKLSLNYSVTFQLEKGEFHADEIGRASCRERV